MFRIMIKFLDILVIAKRVLYIKRPNVRWSLQYYKKKVKKEIKQRNVFVLIDFIGKVWELIWFQRKNFKNLTDGSRIYKKLRSWGNAFLIERNKLSIWESFSTYQSSIRDNNHSFWSGDVNYIFRKSVWTIY